MVAFDNVSSKLRITYNAPVVLTFAVAAVIASVAAPRVTSAEPSVTAKPRVVRPAAPAKPKATGVPTDFGGRR